MEKVNDYFKAIFKAIINLCVITLLSIFAYFGKDIIETNKKLLITSSELNISLKNIVKISDKYGIKLEEQDTKINDLDKRVTKIETRLDFSK